MEKCGITEGLKTSLNKAPTEYRWKTFVMTLGDPCIVGLLSTGKPFTSQGFKVVSEGSHSCMFAWSDTNPGNMYLLISAPSDLFQIHVSYIYKSNKVYYLKDLNMIQQKSISNGIQAQKYIFQIANNQWLISSPIDF
jgi:hypothetical protein